VFRRDNFNSSVLHVIDLHCWLRAQIECYRALDLFLLVESLDSFESVTRPALLSIPDFIFELLKFSRGLLWQLLSLENVFICRCLTRILLRQFDDLWRWLSAQIERPRGHAWPQSLDGVATVKRLLSRRSERRISLEQSTAMSWLSYILSAKLVAALLSGDSVTRLLRRSLFSSWAFSVGVQVISD
jgi:hypothetical protein